ncbi:adenylyltransferase/cytidyltransferase family protein [Photobacterium angustum]|uniref:ethanolamine-phosphate cytidylyltransferase n=1 Tax=Photobacterium angustum TaxID=661 RepID=A0A2S7VW86_PHOAN|nr:adenylyltransferase/cytidyltransferase family protein [Photobacterium angustum]PQJ66349.1 hypothetical protein BTO08_02400 [Photobacterium angustum]
MIIYTSGVFDLLHASHVRALKAAKFQGGEDAKLVVGVATDEDTMAYKRKPVIPYEQRLKMIESLDFVDKVITAPLFTCEQFYKLFSIDIHVQGEDDAGEINYYKGGKDLGLMKFIGRDPIESTTSCITKLTEIVGDDFIVENLGGGISNITWKVTSYTNKKQYVLKYLQSSSIESFSLRHDCIILGGTFALYEYIEGTVGHVTSAEMNSYFVDRLSYYEHGASINPKTCITSIDLFLKYAKFDSSLKLDINLIDEVLDNSKWCWSHNDLVRENIIKTTDGIKFIDWEFADYSPVEMDVASCVLNDVIDIDDVDSQYFNLKFIYILVLLQAKAWTGWYNVNIEKRNDEIMNFYTNKFNLFQSKLDKLNAR